MSIPAMAAITAFRSARGTGRIWPSLPSIAPGLGEVSANSLSQTASCASASMPWINSAKRATHSQIRGIGEPWISPYPRSPSSVRTSVRITDHALISSCAVHTGSGRGTDTGCVLIDAIRVITLSSHSGAPAAATPKPMNTDLWNIDSGSAAARHPGMTIGLFRRVRQQHRFRRIVCDAGGMEILDLRVHAVALADAVEPRPAVEGFGVAAVLPQIDAAGPAVLGIDELLPDQPRHAAEAWRDVAEMLGTGLEIDRGRQFVLHDRGDHRVSPFYCAACCNGGAGWPSAASTVASAAAIASARYGPAPAACR